MKFQFDWTEASTKRGAIRLAVFVVGLFMIFTEKGSIEQLLLLGTGINAMIGMGIKDKQ